MDCNKLREILTDYIYGELSAAENGEVEKHLADCPTCRKQVEELRGVLQVYRDTPKPALPQKRVGKALKEANRIRKEEEEERRRKRVVRPSMLRRLAFHPVSLAAAMIAIVFAVLLDQWESPETYNQRKGSEIDLATKDGSSTSAQATIRKDDSGPLMPVDKKAEEATASAPEERDEAEAMPQADRDIAIPPAPEHGTGQTISPAGKKEPASANGGELQQKPEGASPVTPEIQTGDEREAGSEDPDNENLAPEMTVPDTGTKRRATATAPAPGVTIPEPELPTTGRGEAAPLPPPPAEKLEAEGTPERDSNITAEERTQEESTMQPARPLSEAREAPATDDEVAEFADMAANAAHEENKTAPAPETEDNTAAVGGGQEREMERALKARKEPDANEERSDTPTESAEITAEVAADIATSTTPDTEAERERTLAEVEELVRKAEAEGRFGAETVVSAGEKEGNEIKEAGETTPERRTITALDKKGKAVRSQSNYNLAGGMQSISVKKETEEVTLSRDWSEAVNGLQARITLEQERYRPDIPVVVQYQVRNTSEEEVKVYIAGFWPNHRIDVFNANGELAELTPAGKRHREVFDPDGERGQDTAMPLEPGAVDRDLPPVDLRDLFVLDKPGAYLVRYIYQEEQPEGWSGKLPSNTLQFEMLED